MPMGPYKDFADCVNKQMAKHKGEKGFTVENARAVCGAIKKKIEG